MVKFHFGLGGGSSSQNDDSVSATQNNNMGGATIGGDDSNPFAITPNTNNEIVIQDIEPVLDLDKSTDDDIKIVIDDNQNSSNDNSEINFEGNTETKNEEIKLNTENEVINMDEVTPVQNPPKEEINSAFAMPNNVPEVMQNPFGTVAENPLQNNENPFAAIPQQANNFIGNPFSEIKNESTNPFTSDISTAGNNPFAVESEPVILEAVIPQKPEVIIPTPPVNANPFEGNLKDNVPLDNPFANNPELGKTPIIGQEKGQILPQAPVNLSAPIEATTEKIEEKKPVVSENVVNNAVVNSDFPIEEKQIEQNPFAIPPVTANLINSEPVEVKKVENPFSVTTDFQKSDEESPVNTVESSTIFGPKVAEAKIEEDNSAGVFWGDDETDETHDPLKTLRKVKEEIAGFVNKRKAKIADYKKQINDLHAKIKEEEQLLKTKNSEFASMIIDLESLTGEFVERRKDEVIKEIGENKESANKKKLNHKAKN